MSLNVKVPAGYQYAITSYYQRGFVQLDPKVQASTTLDHFFEGSGTSGRFGNQVQGRYEGDFTRSDAVAEPSRLWSPCNQARALQLNIALRVAKQGGASANARGFMSPDSIDGEMTFTFGLEYRRCP